MKKAAAATFVGLVVVIALLAMVPAFLAGAEPGCSGAGVADPAPNAQAQKGIPANYLRLYRESGRKYGVPWTVLAGVGQIETNHGRLKAPGVTSGANFAGAGGPMQFLQATFDQYAVDGNRDGKKDRYDPADAIPSAAKYLKASGAPGDLRRAIFAYNHADWYVEKVLSNARGYSGKSAQALSAPANEPIGGGCDDGGGLSGPTGKWKLAPGANRPGKDITVDLRRFVDRMAGVYPGKLVLTTGTNHQQFSSSGLPSDHYEGNGADFGMVLNGGANDSPVGDRIAASAFMAAGLPRDSATTRARQGGAQTVTTNGLRVQIIWKSDVGGDHHNHVHVGIKRVGQ